jgi:acetyl esterase/lipase
MAIKHLLVISLSIFVNNISYSQDVRLPLYEKVIPNSKQSNVVEELDKEYSGALKGISVPEITVYFPTNNYTTKQAVLICPGGGYYIESMELEGRDVARYLSTIGVTAIVLKYRLPSDATCVDKHLVPLMDVKRAMRIVRSKASEWNIDLQKVGVMGFSAGGHLASTLGTKYDNGDDKSSDSIEHQSCKPNFMILLYPVITFNSSYTHTGSRRMLLGDSPSPELIEYFSNELHINSNTPPTFITVANNDDLVSNSLLLYEALLKNKVSTELHIFSEGGHGFGIAAKNDHVNFWTQNLKYWLRSISTTTK